MKVAAWLYAFTLLSSSGKVFDFDTCPIGQAPPGWTVEGEGKSRDWQVRKDRTAPTPPYVLAVSADPSETWSILNSVTTRDADVSVRIKPISGREGLAGGVVWRYRDAKNYYAARASATHNTISVFKVENGHTIPLFTDVKHPIPANSWSILKVSVRGSRFQVFFDHRRVLDGRDGGSSTSGRVGLWALGDSTIYFDDFRVYPK